MRFFIAAVLVAMQHVAGRTVPAPITTQPVFVQSGEVTYMSANIMARCNSEKDSKATLYFGNKVMQTKTSHEATDWTVHFHVSGLTSFNKYEYYVGCAPLAMANDVTKSKAASFRTLPQPTDAVDLSFVWLSCLAGQGWGRNPNLSITTVDGKKIKGGYIIFDVISSMNPDFAIFQGDLIYGDNSIVSSREIPAEVGGGTWTNRPFKNFIAVTLKQFRANWKYNFGDDKMASFLADTPVYVQWDDHEVTNNWYPGEILLAAKFPWEANYTNGTSADSLYLNSRQAFYEYSIGRIRWGNIWKFSLWTIERIAPQTPMPLNQR
jgi:alkaline phosphatase D